MHFFKSFLNKFFPQSPSQSESSDSSQQDAGLQEDDLDDSEGVNARVLEPHAKAGVQLASCVLKITGMALISSCIYLVIEESIQIKHLDKLENDTLHFSYKYPSEKNSILLGIEKSIESSHDIVQLTPEEVAYLNAFFEEKRINGIISEHDKIELKSCLEGKWEINRPKCLMTLHEIDGNNFDESKSVKVDSEAKNVLKLAQERYTAFHSFWLQAVQLILLNLLLPLLTGLFGYIFGSRKSG